MILADVRVHIDMAGASIPHTVSVTLMVYYLLDITPRGPKFEADFLDNGDGSNDNQSSISNTSNNANTNTNGANYAER